MQQHVEGRELELAHRVGLGARGRHDPGVVGQGVQQIGRALEAHARPFGPVPARVDDQADPNTGVANAKKIVSDPAILCVDGHYNSGVQIPSSEEYHTAGLANVSPANTNPKVTDRGYIEVNRIVGRDDMQGAVGAQFAKQKGVTSVYVIHDKTTYGQGLADEFKKNLGAGAQVVYYGGIIQGDKDFKSVLTTIKSNNPEIIYFGGIYPEGGLLVKQAKEISLNAPFVSGDGVIDPKFIEIAGDSAEGTYVTFSPDPATIPSAAGFLDEYHKRYGPHGPYSIYAYDAGNIMMKAIAETGKTDGKTIADKIKSGSFEGALGKVEFDAKGDNKIANYVIWQVKGGKFEQVTK